MDSRRVQPGSPHLFRDGPVPASCFLVPLLPQKVPSVLGGYRMVESESRYWSTCTLFCVVVDWSHAEYLCSQMLLDFVGQISEQLYVQGSSGPVFGLIGGDSKHLSFVFTLCRISARLSPSRCFHQGSRQGSGVLSIHRGDVLQLCFIPVPSSSSRRGRTWTTWTVSTLCLGR